MSLSKSVVHASVRRLIPSPVAPVAAIAAISRVAVAAAIAGVATIVGPPGLSLGLGISGALAVVEAAVDAVVVETAVAVVVDAAVVVGGGVVGVVASVGKSAVDGGVV